MSYLWPQSWNWWRLRWMQVWWSSGLMVQCLTGLNLQFPSSKVDDHPRTLGNLKVLLANHQSTILLAHPSQRTNEMETVNRLMNGRSNKACLGEATHPRPDWAWHGCHSACKMERSCQRRRSYQGRWWSQWAVLRELEGWVGYVETCRIGLLALARQKLIPANKKIGGVFFYRYVEWQAWQNYRDR